MLLSPKRRKNKLPFDITNATIQADDGKHYRAGDVISTTTVETPTYGGFWSDIDANPPKVHRFRDRVFVGNAVLMNASRDSAPNAATWIVDSSTAPTYLTSSGMLNVMHERGGTAIVGMTRRSDQGSDTGMTGIGVAGFALADKAAARGWGGYFEVQFEQGTAGYALELDAKNKTASDITTTPYSTPNGGTYGAWIAGGGDSSMGGVPTNPSTAAIAVVKNGHTWNTGIVFDKEALTGVDGTTGSGACAIAMAKGHQIKWFGPGNIGGASIESLVVTTNTSTHMQFQDNAIYFNGSESTSLVRIIKGASATPANYLQLSSGATTVAPRVIASGTDTNVDLHLVAQGTGVIKFGTHTANGDAAISGYITIKDSGGTTRKLAVIT
jgi:hypothetical protein